MARAFNSTLLTVQHQPLFDGGREQLSVKEHMSIVNALKAAVALEWFLKSGNLDYIRDGMDRDTKDPDVLEAQATFDKFYKLAKETVG